MQPCSQPRYGLTLVSKPMSGLSLWAMMLWEWSRRNCVPGAASSSGFHSESRSSEIVSKRFCGLLAAPRERGDEGFFVTLESPSDPTPSKREWRKYFHLTGGAARQSRNHSVSPCRRNLTRGREGRNGRVDCWIGVPLHCNAASSRSGTTRIWTAVAERSGDTAFPGSPAPKRRGASLPAAVQNVVAALPRCALRGLRVRSDLVLTAWRRLNTGTSVSSESFQFSRPFVTQPKR